MLRGHLFALAAALAVLLAVGGCSRRQAPAGASAALAAASVSWPAVAGAERYVVRAWSGYHLLFEITTADTTLVLTSSMSRAIAAFDSASAEIAAHGAAQVLSRVSRPLWPRPPRGEDGAGGGT